MTVEVESDVLESFVLNRAQDPVASVQPLLRGLRERGFVPTHILDIGANVGGWTRTAKSVFPDARISMFEPQASLADELEQVCADLPNVHLYRMALGAKEERRDLALRAEHTSSTFCDVGDYGPPQGVQPTQIVPLDSLLDGPDFPPAQLVKVDTEGFEMEVFGGAERALAQAEVLIVECSFFQWYPMTPRFADVVSYLHQRDFEVYDFSWFMRRPLDGALGIADVVFARNGSLLRANHRWAPAESVTS